MILIAISRILRDKWKDNNSWFNVHKTKQIVTNFAILISFVNFYFCLASLNMSILLTKVLTSPKQICDYDKTRKWYLTDRNWFMVKTMRMFFVKKNTCSKIEPYLHWSIVTISMIDTLKPTIIQMWCNS